MQRAWGRGGCRQPHKAHGDESSRGGGVSQGRLPAWCVALGTGSPAPRPSCSNTLQRGGYGYWAAALFSHRGKRNKLHCNRRVPVPAAVGRAGAPRAESSREPWPVRPVDHAPAWLCDEAESLGGGAPNVAAVRPMRRCVPCGGASHAVVRPTRPYSCPDASSIGVPRGGEPHRRDEGARMPSRKSLGGGKGEPPFARSLGMVLGGLGSPLRVYECASLSME